MKWRQYDQKLHDILTSILPTGLGDVPSPEEYAGRPGKPYCIIYPLITSDEELMLVRDAMLDALYQVTCVGGTHEQCRWAQEKVEAAFALTANLGNGIIGIDLDSGGATNREDDVTYAVTDTFRVKVSQ